MSFEPPPVYLGLGSNLGNRAANLRMALRLLQPLCRVEAVSSLYETDPIDGEGQPPYYNAVCRVSAGLQPDALLHHLKNVENEIGRRPSVATGPAPRPIDLDILFYGDAVISVGEHGRAPLTIPHPRLAERGFVLVPLAELHPNLLHPTLQKTIQELRDATGDQSVRSITPPGWER